MLDTSHLPLVQASGDIWTKFDDLRDLVRSRAGRPIAMEGSAQNREKLKSLLEMIEELERIRTAAVKDAEATEKDDNETGAPTDHDTQYSSDAPVPGSSRQPEASHPEAGNPEISNRDYPARAPDADFPAVTPPISIPRIPPPPDAGFESYPLYGGPAPYYTRGSRSRRRPLDAAHLPAYGHIRPVLVRPLVSPDHWPAHPHLTSLSSSYPPYVVNVDSYLSREAPIRPGSPPY